MKLIRLSTLLLISTLALSACGKDDSTAPSAAAAPSSTDKNNLLALVPANTPYLGGTLAPLPEAVIDSYLKRFEPAKARLQENLNKTKLRLEANPDELADDPAARIVHALLTELDGKLNRAGLESLGIDIRAQTVVYGMSAFPIMRTSLADADTLRATVQRVLDNAKVEAPALEFQGQSYWRYIPEMREYDEFSTPVLNSAKV